MRKSLSNTKTRSFILSISEAFLSSLSLNAFCARLRAVMFREVTMIRCLSPKCIGKNVISKNTCPLFEFSMTTSCVCDMPPFNNKSLNSNHSVSGKHPDICHALYLSISENGIPKTSVAALFRNSNCPSTSSTCTGSERFSRI